MTKELIVLIFFLKVKTRTCWKGERRQWLLVFGFRVREWHFSLKYRAIRPSAVFGTRRKAALRGEAYEWVPDLRSLDKLREVGDSPYLGFTLCLRAMLMFELIKVVSGRLIGPKTWDRIVRIFLSPLYAVRGG